MQTDKNNSDEMVDVVISGLGPTGLVLAHILGQRGHHVVVLEREPVFYGNARAVYTDDECMRIFQSIGMADELQKDMLVDTPVQLARPDGSVIMQYKPLKRPNGWSIINFFYQPYLETSLTQGLKKYPNIELRRGRELIDFQQDQDKVLIQHQATQEYRFSDQTDTKIQSHTDLDIQSIAARYLIGADGGRSTVRAKLGIEMTGKNFPEPWLVVDLKQKQQHKGLRHLPYFNFVVDPNLPVVSCVQPDGHHRFEFLLKKDQSKEQMEQPEMVRALISKYVNPDDFEVKRKLVYTFNALVAKKWRDQRVLLAGDAAHMTPQFMGQGASSGIRDAYNLGWKLSHVLLAKADEKLLDSYSDERHDHAKAMIDSSVFLKDLVSMTNPISTKFRDGVIKMIQHIPKLKTWAQEGGLKPDPIYTKGHYFGLSRQYRCSVEGSLAPQPMVRNINGKRVLLDDVLGRDYAILGFACDPTEKISEQSMQILDYIGTRFITVHSYAGRPQGSIERDFNQHVTEVEDVQGEWEKWMKRATKKSEQNIVILRPDRFVFAVVSSAQLNDAILQLKQQLNLSDAKEIAA